MIVLDASVVIAFLDASDPHHERAVRMIESHAADGFAMHPLTLAEVLVGAVRIGRAARLLADLRVMGVRTHAPSEDEPLTLAELRADTGLKMPDCCVLTVATQQPGPLATFDDQLARAAAELGVAVLRD
ncbi:type II toxin-antitoxin system VapC family toxin [Salinibacterium sp. SYSU T00001]|uniref:type II toxin-antitoxin system VapC family toxin n=1 Tax=Homoserinimonas sedimenticola TaxID=2986805 RepID=UPI002235BE21|nr:type II toxin-antitoxin system VapC family toxin [Salinibacterium sedimenticola]MCW4386314.1 type II toxin-antitoxin system VapC family toxin [Salinibacterium sedimenticola]